MKGKQLRVKRRNAVDTSSLLDIGTAPVVTNRSAATQSRNKARKTTFMYSKLSVFTLVMRPGADDLALEKGGHFCNTQVNFLNCELVL